MKELQAWNLVRLQHLPGDRRDHFTTPDDIWGIIRTLTEERKKREIDPTLSVLRGLAMEPPITPEEAHAQARMRQMTEAIELITNWYDDVRRLDTDRLAQLLSLGAKVQKVLEMKDRLTDLPGFGRGKSANPTSRSKNS